MNLENFTPEEIDKLRGILKSQEPEEEKQVSPEATKTPLVKGSRKAWYKNKVILSFVAFLGVILLAALYVFAVEPWLALRAAEAKLAEDKAKASVIVGNGDFISFVPESEEDILPGANPKQLALGSDGEITHPSYFEFTSANADSNSKILDLYIDFYSQRSRDLVALNNQTLANYIGSGEVILRVHPVVDKAGFSIFAPEALAEVFGTHPEYAWEFFVTLMRNSDSILSNPNTEEASEASNQEIIDFIAGVSAGVGVPTGSPDGVDADSIQFLTFFSWLYSGSRDPNISVGYYPPILYIDGEEVDQDVWILTDPDSFLRLLATS